MSIYMYSIYNIFISCNIVINYYNYLDGGKNYIYIIVRYNIGTCRPSLSSSALAPPSNTDT